jgi:hypothetical protein
MTETDQASAAPPGRLLYAIPEVAALTGRGMTWTYGEIRAGRLRTVMAGRRRMITAAALAEWIAAMPPGASMTSGVGHRAGAR